MNGPEGRFKGKALAPTVTFGQSGTGTEQIGVVCELTDGPAKGRQAAWYGFFNTQENTERALRSLIHLGWDGVDITKLTGLGSKEAMLTCGNEEYNGNTSWKIKFVDDLESTGVIMKSTYDKAQVSDFASRIAGAVAECRQKGIIPKPGSKPTPAAAGAKPQANSGGAQQSSRANEDTGDIPF